MNNESQPSQYDAVFVFGYWPSRDRNPMPQSMSVSGFRGGLRARLSTRAAALMENQADKIVFATGKLKGPLNPSSAEIFEHEMVQKYKVSPDKLVVTNAGHGTEEEAETFKQLARENGWQNVAVVAFNTHYKSVEKSLPQGKVDTLQVTHLPVEKIIEEKDRPHAINLVRSLTKVRFRSPVKNSHDRILFRNPVRIPWQEVGFKAYEFSKDMFMRVSWLKKLIYSKNKQARTMRDSKFNNIVTHAIDVFNS